MLYDTLPCISDLKISELDINNQNFLDLAKVFSKEEGTVILLSGGDNDCSRYNIMAIRPWLEIKTKSTSVYIKLKENIHSIKSNPINALKKIMEHFKIDIRHYNINFPILCGLFGYISYDLKDQIEDIPSLAIDDTNLPDILLYSPRYVFIQDIQTKKIFVIMILLKNEKVDFNLELKNLINYIDSYKDKKNFFYIQGDIYSNFKKQEYIDAILKIKDYIVQGDVYQVNMSQRFMVSFNGDAYHLFTELFKLNPASFFAYINGGNHKIVSTSPERFLYQEGRYVETRPIKGTRPRGKDYIEDKTLIDDLKNSEKDDAELSMIVDLLRNDIGKVCKPSSVKVKKHKRIEKYKNVFHLVSIVTGELKEDADSIDLIKATFPGGSITGCPKIRAMEIIEELEPTKRHIYTGSIGYISFHNTMDLSIAIRTATILQDKIILSVGGGIVYDSDPEMEFEETIHKGNTFFKLFNKIKHIDEKWIWLNGKFIKQHTGMVPITSYGFQYGMGLFETIRAEHGKVYFLDMHINRLEKGWHTLFDVPMPDIDFKIIIEELLKRNKLMDKLVAIKIIAALGDRNYPPYDYMLSVTAKKYTPRIDLKKRYGLKVGIYPQKRSTPLASFKTLNYMYYFNAKKWAEKNNFDEAIILNPDGSISEGNSTNIILIQKNNVYIPESEYFLKGIMLNKTMDFLKDKGFNLISKKIYPEDLPKMDEVILTNSLIGALGVECIDSMELSKPLSPLFWEINKHFFKYWR